MEEIIMKRTLSLIVTLLLALAVMPVGGFANTAGYKASTEAGAFRSRSVKEMSENERRWAGLDAKSLAETEGYAAAMKKQAENRDSKYPVNWEEAERVSGFYWDEIESETSDFWGLSRNIDRLYGQSVTELYPDK